MSSDITDALRTLTYGLYIVTVHDGVNRNAMPASWVSQVSFNPPRIMVAVKKTRLTHRMLTGAKEFGLMVVQKGLERDFAAYKGNDPEAKFAGKTIVSGKNGTPLLPEYLTTFDLALVLTVDAGDHTLFIGEVQMAEVTSTGTPATTLDYGKTYIGDY
jgi:flavin reductase (DIM6/NTAB) family NADH-FMN oxidoreductase RutF